MENKIRISKDSSLYELADLDLRIIRCLVRHGILTVGELASLESSYILKIRGIGVSSLAKIQSSLSLCDFSDFTGYDLFSRIKQLVNSHHISISRLSKDTGITTTTIYNWKCSQFFPSVKSLIAIADYFDVTLDYLCGRG